MSDAYFIWLVAVIFAVVGFFGGTYWCCLSHTAKKEDGSIIEIELETRNALHLLAVCLVRAIAAKQWGTAKNLMLTLRSMLEDKANE